jgi:hypothetical protein
MALPILDGNQSPTTLSTIIVSNAHIPAHTVTSLGTQAITDIATAVSGVELGPNTLNALENITVTLGQVTITGGLTDTQLRASAVTIGGTVTVGSIVTHGVTIANSSVTIGGSVTATISGTPSVTFTQIATHGVTIGAGTAQIGSVTASISGTPSITFGTAVITGSASILNFPATQTVTFTQITTHGVIIGAGTAQIGSVTASISGTVPISISSVTVGNSVTIGSLPALPTGTNRIGVVTIGAGTVTIGAGTAQIGSVTASGTVTASLDGWELLGQRNFFSDASLWIFNRSIIELYSSLAITFGNGDGGSIEAFFSPISGQDNDIYWSSPNGVRTRIITSGAGVFTTTAIPAGLFVQIVASPINSQTASLYGKKNSTLALTNTQLRASAIQVSGTVTANLSRPTWTNYSGTVTTANTAITAISTTTRSYLLAQVTTGQMFLNIGATATSLNSVYFSAGQGFAWETTVPQGFVSIISAVTGTNYVLKEG